MVGYPTGSKTYCHAIDVRSDGRIYIATRYENYIGITGGTGSLTISYSDNGGSTWTSPSSPLENISNADATAWTSLSSWGNNVVASLSTGKVFYSTDGGKTYSNTTPSPASTLQVSTGSGFYAYTGYNISSPTTMISGYSPLTVVPPTTPVITNSSASFTFTTQSTDPGGIAYYQIRQALTSTGRPDTESQTYPYAWFLTFLPSQYTGPNMNSLTIGGNSPPLWWSQIAAGNGGVWFDIRAVNNWGDKSAWSNTCTYLYT